MPDHTVTAIVAATVLALAAAAHAAGPVPVEVGRDESGAWRLLRGGVPYVIRGAGIDGGRVESLVAHGGNSFRTWSTDGAKEKLDAAERLGVTVVLCINIGRERHGFDYDDTVAVAAQLEFARREVLKYRDHPALLAWMIGNEPNLFYTNPEVFDAINDISRMIHEVDGRHPTTTALAGFDESLAEVIGRRAPDLDFVSIQMYGAIVHLPQIIRDIGYDEPFLVTEWGATGHWEVGKTDWGVPIEQHSSEKAASYRRAYEGAIAAMPGQVLGSYVFLWGQKQERTPTWYGMFLADGSETEVIDVLHYEWNGEWPANRSPRISAMTLDGRRSGESVVLLPGETYAARLEADDPDGDSLTYRWVVMRESAATQEGGDREEIPEIVAGAVSDADTARQMVRAPEQPGPYRLFAYVHDGNGNAGHANVPFLVRKKGSNRN